VNAKYNFEYSGKIADKHTIDAVKANLSKMFAVSNTEWDTIFNGKARFVKHELDEFTAKLYFEQFKKVGAIGVIRKNASENSSTQDNIEEIEETDNDEDLIRSARFFKIGMFIFILIFTIDSFFQHYFFDIGAAFYALPLVLFAIASYFDMLARGYPGWIGALAGASIVGLPLLQFVPSRLNNAPNKLSPIRMLASIAVAVILAYFLFQKAESGAQLLDYQQQASNMTKDWGEYPNGQLKQESEIHNSVEKIKAFLIQGNKLSTVSSLRKKQQRDLASLMHYSNARFFRWLNYQRYLHFTERQEIPNFLSTRNMEKLKKELITIYHDFYVSYKYFLAEFDFYLANELSNELHNTSMKYSFKITDPDASKKYTPGILQTNKKLFGETKNPSEGIFEIYINNNLKSIARGKYVAFATIILPARNRYDRDMPETLIIGGNMPEFDMGNTSMFQQFRLPTQHHDAVRLLLE